MAKAPQQRCIQCYHCDHRFDIAARAVSASCPKCHKHLEVRDLVISRPDARTKLHTCGSIIIERKGSLRAADIVAHGGLYVQGSLIGNVTSGQLVHLGPKASWQGNLCAPALRVELGARITEGYFNIPTQPLTQENPAPD